MCRCYEQRRKLETTDVTVNEISEAYIQWVGAAGSGLSGRATAVVEKLVDGGATQTAAINAYVQQIGEGMRSYATKAQFYADSVSAIGNRSVYATAAEYYAKEANKLLDQSMGAIDRLNRFTAETQLKLN